MVDTLASKVSAFGREGSTPSFRIEELRFDQFTCGHQGLDTNLRITHVPTGTIVVGTGQSRGTKSMYKLKQILLAELHGKLRACDRNGNDPDF